MNDSKFKSRTWAGVLLFAEEFTMHGSDFK